PCFCRAWRDGITDRGSPLQFPSDPRRLMKTPACQGRREKAKGRIDEVAVSRWTPPPDGAILCGFGLSRGGTRHADTAGRTASDRPLLQCSANGPHATPYGGILGGGGQPLCARASVRQGG